jgi:copper transport protein
MTLAPARAPGTSLARPWQFPARSRRAWFPARWRDAWLPAAVAALLVLGVPGRASAHALLVSSTPKPNQQLGTTPGVVTLVFSEPLTKESTASVTDPDGRVFSDAVSGVEMLIRLTTNAPGQYRVQWKSVSSLDGHVIRGSFTFEVGVVKTSAKAGGGNLARFGILLTVERAVEDIALLLAIGMLVLQGAAGSAPGLRRVKPRLCAALAAAAVAALAVMTTEAFSASASASLGAVLTYLGHGFSGAARAGRAGCEALAAVLARTRASAVTWLLVLGAVVGLAASGHAAAVRPEWWGISLDAAHIAAAGVWAGGILALVTLRPPGGWRGPEERRLLARFSPVALSAFAGTVGLGVAQAVAEVGRVRALVTTDFGWVLLVKAALVAAMIPLSLQAWRGKRGLFRAEAALAVAVIAAAALLGAYPAPAVDLAAKPPPPAGTLSGLPVAGELTLGSHAGGVLVGLSLKPGAPGVNQAFVYLLPIEGAQAARGLKATLTVDGQPAPLTVCGTTCRRATLTLAGGETVVVTVPGSEGGTATFPLPALPAPSGGALLQSMQAAMHRLTSWEDDEQLSAGILPPEETDYLFQAPDRIEQKTASGIDIRSIGATRYSLTPPDQAWKVQTGGAPPVVPSFTWDYFKPLIDATVVGHGTVDGVPTTILAFFGESYGLPAWFQMWVDAQGLAHQVDMRAQGHVMDDHYLDFNGPIDIVAPAGAG